MKKEREIYIGCSGWSYKAWKGPFYPETLSLKEHFSYYTNIFNTVEVNSTFYHFPTQKTVESWYNLAPKEFKFSLKANREITHIKRFKMIEEPLKRFYSLSDILKEKLAYFLFQFPPSFRFTDEKLDQIILHLNSNYKNVVEFRHPSWWNSKVIQVFESENITFCTVNGFDMPEIPIVINNKIHLRFHGKPAYSSLYSDEILSEWAVLLNNLSLKEIYIYFNNTQHSYTLST